MSLSLTEKRIAREIFRLKYCCLPYTDNEYTPPTGKEIKEVLNIEGWTYAEAARLLGVSSGKDGRSTTVQKWVAGERKIPYSAWRLLLAYSRIKDMDKNEADVLLGKM